MRPLILVLDMHVSWYPTWFIRGARHAYSVISATLPLFYGVLPSTVLSSLDSYLSVLANHGGRSRAGLRTTFGPPLNRCLPRGEILLQVKRTIGRGVCVAHTECCSVWLVMLRQRRSCALRPARQGSLITPHFTKFLQTLCLTMISLLLAVEG